MPNDYRVFYHIAAGGWQPFKAAAFRRRGGDRAYLGAGFDPRFRQDVRSAGNASWRADIRYTENDVRRAGGNAHSVYGTGGYLPLPQAGKTQQQPDGKHLGGQAGANIPPFGQRVF